MSSEAFRQFVFLIAIFCSKCLAQNAGNGILGVEIFKISPSLITTLQQIFLGQNSLRPLNIFFARTPMDSITISISVPLTSCFEVRAAKRHMFEFECFNSLVRQRMSKLIRKACVKTTSSNI